MAFIQVKKCLTEPKQLVKLIVLVVCVCITIYQLSECVNKMFHPPVSTYYKFVLNETIRYPSLTICRRPEYRTNIFPKYGLKETAKLHFERNFNTFFFNNHTIEEFLTETTFPLNEVVPLYGYRGSGLSTDVEITSHQMILKGLCHTFTPKENSAQFSIEGGYFLYFMHTAHNKELDDYGVSTSGFEIYIHGPNEILTGQEIQENSFMEFIYLETSEDMHVTLKLQTFTQISTSREPCISDPNYSKSKCQEECVHRQIAAKVGCTLPWLRVAGNYSQCSDYVSVRALITGFNKFFKMRAPSDCQSRASENWDTCGITSYYHRSCRNSGVQPQYFQRKNMLWAPELNRTNFLSNCDCEISCNIDVYSTHIESRKEADHLTKPGSTINLYFSSNLITQMEEVLGYDWNAFLADIGGSMGFLLGLSVIGIITVIEDVLHMIFNCKKTDKNDADNLVDNEIVKEKPMLGTNIQSVVDFLADCEFYERQSEESKKMECNQIKY